MTFDLPGVEPGSDIEKLFKGIGFVVVQWGFAEQSLDLIVASIFHAFDGHPSLKRRPQHLEPKIEFLTECFTTFPELAQFKVEGEALMDRFSATGKMRNDLVHGAITATSEEDGAFMFLKIDVRGKQPHSVRSIFLDDSDWTDFRRELLRLGKDGQSLTRRVWDTLKERT